MKRRKANYCCSIAIFLAVLLSVGTDVCHGLRESCPSNEICLNDGECYLNRSLDNVEFECECKPGFQGVLCENTVEKPLSQDNPVVSTSSHSCSLECQNGGQCVPGNDSISRDYCKCAQGFIGELCSTPGDCRISGCQGPAKVCLYDLSTASFQCEDDLCAFRNPCANNATCRPSKNDFFCECAQGLQGKLCEEDIDECSLQTASQPACRNRGLCRNLVGGFRCDCPSGFGGEICEQSIGFCHQNPCGGRGACQELPGSFVCHCFANYTGKKCEQDVTPKISCDAFHQLVINSDGGAPECLCKQGMTGEKCDIPIDLCLQYNSCLNGGQCISNANKTFCICPSTFIGHLCEIPVNECRVDGRPCLNGAQCMWDDIANSTTCNCSSPRFQGKWCDQLRLDVTLPSTPSPLDILTVGAEVEMPCPSDFCSNGGSCYAQSPGQSSKDGLAFGCHCPTNVSGARCELVIKEDNCENNPCANGGTCGMDKDSRVECSCLDGFVGKHCEKECNCAPGQLCRQSGGGGAECYTSYRVSALNHTSSATTNPTSHLSPSLSLIDSNFPLPTTLDPQPPPNQPDSAVLNHVSISSCKECVNAVKCLILDKQPVCLCSPQFSGPLCDLQLSICASVNCTPPQECQLRRTPSGDTPSCSCAKGTIGEKCEQNSVATFTNTSVFLQQSNGVEGQEYSLKFSFRTTLRNANIVNGQDILDRLQFGIGLKEGRLLLTLGEDVKITDLLALDLNDDNWYTIQLTNSLVAGTSIEVLDDSTGYVLANRQLGAMKYTSVFMTRFGRRDDNTYFAGCLRDVHLNQAPLDILNKQRSIDVWPGCVRQPQCTANTCQNGGQCLDQWTSFSCQCKRPFVGKLCEHRIVEATFGHENGSSLVEYSLNTQDASLILMSTNISFLMRTKAKRATIFYLGNKEEDELTTFLGAQIDQGFLKVNTRLGGNKVYSSKSAARIDDNKQHLVEISRVENEIVIKIDTVTQPSVKVDRPFAHPLLADQLLIGGANVGINGKSVDPPSFKGSLQDMRVNGQLVSLVGSPPSQAPQFGSRKREENILEGSVSDDVCTQLDPCSSNATCSNTFNDFECQCKAGWMGKLCDEQDFCSVADRCPPPSTCVNSNKGFVCTSTATFSGTSSIKYALHLPPSQTPLKQNNISFEVRTRTANSALLKLQSSSESLFLELRDSHVVVLYSNQSSGPSEPAVVSPDLLANGQWHQIGLVERIQKLYLMLDNTTAVPLAIPFSLKKFVLDRNSQITFGKTGNVTSFKGCLRNATFGSLPPLFFLSKEHFMDSLVNTVHFTAVVRNNIRPDGCYSDEVCGRMNECKNRAVCVDDFNQRSCQCVDGFEGPLCELNIDDCKTSDGTTRCGPHSVCVDGIHSYSCQCANGFSGEHCDVVEELCGTKSPCLNGGKCAMLDADYHCTCPTQFMGRNCQMEKRSVKCSDHPCENNGKCVESEMGLVKCLCQDDHFSGDLCDIPANFCNQMPCQNGGQCLQFPTNYTCQCPSLYQGPRCEVYADVCSSEKPCQHNSTCANVFGGYLCSCGQGWRGPTCEMDVDECLEDAPCQNNGVCTNTPGAYTCKCPKFYSGDHCEIVGICARDPCLNQGECLQESPNQHTCKCPRGYRGNLCEEQINYCLQEPCHNGATCMPRLAGFECLCIAGFTGTTCETDIDECAAGDQLCAHNGTCVDRVNGFECNCGGTGWQGPQCLEDINECANPASNCLHGQCTNMPGDYECKCHGGFIGKKCNMVNPCLPDVHNRTLHNCAHGRCVNPVVIRQYSGREVTQHDCECHKGYAGPMCTVLVQPSRSIALGFILGPITVVLIVLCVFGTMLFLFVARKKRANQGTYSPSTQEMTGAARVQVRDNKKFREGYQGNY